MQIQQIVSNLETFIKESIFRTINPGENKSINKYYLGNDLDLLPLLNNADKYAKFNVFQPQ